MVYINLKMAEKTAQNGRGQNRGELRAPFCSLNPTKSKILDPPLCLDSSAVFMNEPNAVITYRGVAGKLRMVGLSTHAGKKKRAN